MYIHVYMYMPGVTAVGRAARVLSTSRQSSSSSLGVPTLTSPLDALPSSSSIMATYTSARRLSEGELSEIEREDWEENAHRGGMTGGGSALPTHLVSYKCVRMHTCSHRLNYSYIIVTQLYMCT